MEIYGIKIYGEIFSNVANTTSMILYNIKHFSLLTIFLMDSNIVSELVNQDFHSMTKWMKKSICAIVQIY